MLVLTELCSSDNIQTQGKKLTIKHETVSKIPCRVTLFQQKIYSKSVRATVNVIQFFVPK